MNRLFNYIYRRQPMFDKQRKFIYFNTAKACQKSVINLLSDRLITRRRYNKERFGQLIADYDSAFKFTIVRNPYDRVVSTFHYLQQLDVLSPADIKQSIDPKLSFKEFIKGDFKTRGVKVNKHFHHQYPNVIYPIKKVSFGKVYSSFLEIVDYMAKFETIKKDWPYIASKIKTIHSLPHVNKSVHEDYRTYYDDECIEIVSKIYKKDLKILNYKFDGV